MPNIYKITNLINGLSYVGKNSTDCKNYFAGGTIINHAKKKHGRENFEKEIIVQGDFNEPLLNELERHYIRLFNTKVPNGYNLTDGGEGIINPTQEIRDKRRKSFTYKHSPEMKKKIGELSLGRKKTPQFAEKMKKAWEKKRSEGWRMPKESVERSLEKRRENGAFIWSKERREKMSKIHKGRLATNRKQVQVFDLKNNFIKEYETLKEACIDFLGYKSADRLRVLLRKEDSCILKGYIFKLKQPNKI